MKVSLSPSAAYRWLRCQASPRFIAENKDKLPKDTSVWAEEGTIAHGYAQSMTILGWSPELFKLEHIEMVGPVKVWYDYVQSNIRSKDDTVLVEQKLPLFYQPSRNGITDQVVVNRDADLHPTRLCVFDYKHGEGVTVDAVDNEQLLIYARNAMNNLGEALSGNLPVLLAIVQPRAREGLPIKEWELTVDDIRNRAEQIEAVAAAIQAEALLPHETTSKHPQLTSRLPVVQEDGGTCQFCEAKALCPAYAKAALAEVPQASAVFQLPSVESLTIEQMGMIHASSGTLKKYLEAVKDHLTALGDQGKLPESSGFKVVQGKSNRVWDNEDEAQRLLVDAVRKANPDMDIHTARDRVAPRKVVSPTQGEELIKPIKDLLSTRMVNSITKLIVKPAGGPTLAPLSDKRPALNPTSDFAAIEIDAVEGSELV